MEETKTPVHVFRDLLTDLLRVAKMEHTSFVERTMSPAEAKAHDWAPWYAEFIVGQLNALGVELDWASINGQLASMEDVKILLSGPMGRAEVDAAKARSYNFGGSDLKPERFNVTLTAEEYRNAFGEYRSQRED